MQDLKLHDKNEGFTWSMPKGPFSFFSDEDIRCFDENGYIILEDAFDAQEISSVIEQIDPFEYNVTEALKGLDGGKFFIARAEEITFTTHLVTQSEALKTFSKHEVFSKICKDLIGPNVRLYWDQAVYKKPGTRDEFPWHQDNGYTFVSPQAYLTCWIPLTDTDESNGCPWVIPKLHKMGTLKHDVTELGYKIKLDDSDAIPVPAKAGDIVVFSSLTPHCTGPNKTDLTRKSYILQYAPNGAVRYPPFSDKEEANNPDRQFFINKKS